MPDHPRYVRFVRYLPVDRLPDYPELDRRRRAAEKKKEREKRTRMKKEKSKKKPVVVDREFLTRLADDIYDPETRRFLRLCTGTLQNGPDPVDGCRTMHCGLGELYFAMTGRHPHEDDVRNEEDVVELAVELSTLDDGRGTRQRLRRAIEALGLPETVQEAALDGVTGLDDEVLSAEEDFREALSTIPSVNDGGIPFRGRRRGEVRDYDRYRSRSARVARLLRKAAALLPG